jgi:hypothetical protein
VDTSNHNLKISHHIDFLIALSIIMITVALSFAIYAHVVRLNFVVRDLRFSHWLSIIGTIGIAVATPLFTLLKRSNPVNYKRIIRLHIFGNLIFFTMITFHFASQVARPLSNLPELGSGLGMFLAMSLQVVLGFTQRFRSQRRLYNKLINPDSNKFAHASLIMVFYVIIVFHVLHGLG